MSIVIEALPLTNYYDLIIMLLVLTSVFLSSNWKLFQESLFKTLNREEKKGQPHIDILEINRLRRQLLFQSYVWDHRLVYLAGLDNSLENGLSSSTLDYEGKSTLNDENLAEMNVAINRGKIFNECDSFLADTKLDKSFDNQEEFGSNADQSDMPSRKIDMGPVPNNGEEQHTNPSTSISIGDQSYLLESKINVPRTLSDGQFPVMTDLSDTLDAAWTGETHPGIGLLKDNICALPDSSMADSSTNFAVVEGLNIDHAEDHNCSKVGPPRLHALSTRDSDNLEDSISWLRMPFLNFYRSLNKNFLASFQKLDTLGEYNPVYVSFFQKSELQSGARLLMPVGVNDTIIPVYEDEPTSIIAHALMSPEYHLQMTDEVERPRESGDFMTSPLSESLNFQSVHSSGDTTIETYRSHGSSDDSNLSLSGSRSSLVLDPLSYTKALHARVSFGYEGGKVKFSVTCYFAKRFESLRRICCPSELDFVRSISRCKKWGAQGGKSNVFFAKTLDDRFIIKQVTKTELESFIKFAPGYFKYLSDAIITGSPTCLAKILGIYQVLTTLSVFLWNLFFGPIS